MEARNFVHGTDEITTIRSVGNSRRSGRVFIWWSSCSSVHRKQPQWVDNH